MGNTDPRPTRTAATDGRPGAVPDPAGMASSPEKRAPEGPDSAPLPGPEGPEGAVRPPKTAGKGPEKGAQSPEKPAETGKDDPKTGAFYPVVAVVVCPPGADQTGAATQALKGAGKRLGIPVKVETQGAEGVQNPLTDAEIAGARAVLLAADRRVELGRFAGKPLLSVSVSDGINKPESLLRRANAGEGELCRAAPGRGTEGEAPRGADGVYRHLAAGVGPILPLVAGGGILTALALLADLGAVGGGDLSALGTATPLAAFLSGLGTLSLRLLLPLLSGYIAQSVAGQPGLAPGLLGGALAASGASFTGVGVPTGFPGALIAGFVAGYVVLALKALSQGLPRALEGIGTVLLYPLGGMAAVGAVMYALGPPAGLLNGAVTGALERLGGAGGLVLGAAAGALMAADLGGPVSKAAYLFGVASLAGGGGSAIMAAVMAGGMVPPLAVALACTFFPRRFSPEGRQSGAVSYLMGLCFLTEGAIPFAAADPARVIPACMVGSALAGGLSMAFGCTSSAPHGGVFVFPVMGNVPLYLLALLVGSVAGMALLGLLKRRRGE